MIQNITIITGRKGEGKTTFVKELINIFRTNGHKICGLYSPGIYENGKKIGINVVNLTNGEKRLLALHDPGWDPDKPIREWRFIDESMNWGNEILENQGQNCGILIIDEIGYLELEKNQGWNAIFDMIQRGYYKQAFIVIRESLLDKALSFWNDARVVFIDKIDEREKFLKEEVKRYQLLSN